MIANILFLTALLFLNESAAAFNLPTTVRHAPTKLTFFKSSHGSRSSSSSSSSSSYSTTGLRALIQDEEETVVADVSPAPPMNIMYSSQTDEDSTVPPVNLVFSSATALALVAGQSLLIAVSVGAAKVLDVPNLGLGADFLLNSESIQYGALATLPLFALAAVLDVFEKSYPPLEDVSKATQRSVLGLLGGARIPIVALLVSIGLGAAAGIGEEMLFRGVIQAELVEKIDPNLALTSTAVIFGLLHAVTPLYALLAGVASLYFGELFLQFHNLAVPIVCHGLYDVGALMAAHIQVTGMTDQEQQDLAFWEPGDAKEAQ